MNSYVYTVLVTIIFVAAPWGQSSASASDYTLMWRDYVFVAAMTIFVCGSAIDLCNLIKNEFFK